MKILLISSYLPYPLHSGGQVRLYNLIKELSGKHEITLVCEKRAHQTAEDVKEVEKLCKKVVTVPRRKQWSLENIAKSAFSSHSFLITGHTHPEMQEKIAEELASNTFDLIHVETFYVMQNVLKSPQPPLHKGGDGSLPPLLKGGGPQAGGFIPIVLVEHNIEYQVYKRFVDRAPLLLRPLLSLDIAKIRKEEEEAWRRATAVVAVSQEDKKVMEEAGLKPEVVANGVDVESFAFKLRTKNQELKTKRILFIGDFKWIQNRDSVEFIIKDIWPKIKQQSSRHSGPPTPVKQAASLRPAQNLSKTQRSNVSDPGLGQDDEGLKLWIVGRHIPDSIRGLTDDPDVLFDEESSGKETSEIFQEASVLLAPIRVGGGTSYKILESMACGTPVVTMQLSASAIHAKDGEQIMVGQTGEELAEKTVQLLQNDKVYEKISTNGRALIEEHYSWKEIAKTLEEVYKKVVNG